MKTFTVVRLPLALAALSLAHNAAGAAVTLYAFSQTDDIAPVTCKAGHSLTVKPISTATDGMTVYEAVEAVTERVVEWTAFSTTRTEVSTPTTITWTFRADASRDQFVPYTATATNTGLGDRTFVVSDNCTIIEDGAMVCVQHIVASGPPGGEPTTTTLEETRTGAAVPWYSLTDANSASKSRLSWGLGALVTGLPALGLGVGVLLV